jgi:maltooligosyltrehalose trehalohydrolase
VVAENEPQDSHLVRDRGSGGYAGDALWNDDFHHSAVVAATGRRDAYYHDYRGSAQEFVSAAKYGYLYQGQHYAWQRKARGTSALDLPARAFVCCLENHDQVANSLDGRRLRQLTSHARFRALTALLLLGPWVPMLFQGQEWGTDLPFLYFADMPGSLREAVTKGRKEFISQFRGAAEHHAWIPDPGAPETFERCRLEWPTGDTDTLRLHRDLIRLRNEDEAFRAPTRMDGAVLGAHSFLLRFSCKDPANDRLLLVNLGATVRRAAVAEPLLAPPAAQEWTSLWDSDHPRYGGQGLGELDIRKGLRLCGESAVVLGGNRSQGRGTSDEP